MTGSGGPTAKTRRRGEDAGVRTAPMRSEAEVREQYEFLVEQLESEEMRHQGVRELFSHYRRALGWVLEEEHM
jgi:hypothetical protein